MRGDVNGDTTVNGTDITLMIAEFFDGDGDEIEHVSERGIQSGPGVDADANGLVNAADILAALRRFN